MSQQLSKTYGINLNRGGIDTCAYVSYRADFEIPYEVLKRIPVAIYDAAPEIWSRGNNCGWDRELNMSILMEKVVEREDLDLIYWLISFDSLDIESSYADYTKRGQYLHDYIYISLSISQKTQ